MVDPAAVALTTDASQLLNHENVRKALQWSKISYVTKQDAFRRGLMPEEQILVKLDCTENCLALVKKD